MERCPVQMVYLRVVSERVRGARCGGWAAADLRPNWLDTRFLGTLTQFVAGSFESSLAPDSPPQQQGVAATSNPGFDISQWYNEHDLDYRTPELPGDSRSASPAPQDQPQRRRPGLPLLQQADWDPNLLQSTLPIRIRCHKNNRSIRIKFRKRSNFVWKIRITPTLELFLGIWLSHYINSYGQGHV